MTTLFAVRRPDGTIVQAAPCAEKEAALWEAAGRDPEVKALWNPESNYNVAAAKRRGYVFVEAEVVERKGEDCGISDMIKAKGRNAANVPTPLTRRACEEAR